MADYTDDDVARLAEMLTGLASTPAMTVAERVRLARYLLNRGVKMPPPPPDLAVVVAEHIRRTYLGYSARPLDPVGYDSHRRLLATVRDLFPADALEAAAAKVQEADRG